MSDYWMDEDQYQVHGPPDNIKLGQLKSLLYDSLINTQHVHSCAFINKKDLHVEARSNNLSLTKADASALNDLFKNFITARNDGFLFKNISYDCVRADKHSIYARGLTSNDQGLILVRTNNYILLSTYTKFMYPAVCIEATEKLSEYLKEKGR